MKTTLQQAIEQIELDIADTKKQCKHKPITEKRKAEHYIAGIRSAQNILTSLLPAEREAIETAYDAGEMDRKNYERNEMNDIVYASGYDYYHQKYDK